MSAFTISGTPEYLQEQIIKIITSADNEEHIINLYSKIMYDIHILAFDVINNKHFFEPDIEMDESDYFDNINNKILESVFDTATNVVSLFTSTFEDDRCYVICDNFITKEFIKSLKIPLAAVANKSILKILPKFLSMEINLNKHFEIHKIYKKFINTDFETIPHEKRKKELLNFFNSQVEDKEIDIETAIIKDESLQNIIEFLTEKEKGKKNEP